MLEDFPSLFVADAAILGDYVAISTHIDTIFRIFVLQIRNEGNVAVVPVSSFRVDGEVTCLSLCRYPEDGAVGLLAGLWKEGKPWFAHALLGEDGQSDLEMMDLAASTTLPPSPPTPFCTLVSFPTRVEEPNKYSYHFLREGIPTYDDIHGTYR